MNVVIFMKRRYMGDFTLKICTMAALTALLCGIARSALIEPKNGQFDIVTEPGMTFNPVPWISASIAESVYLYPFATADYTAGYSGNGAGYNLACAYFNNGLINVTDNDIVTGDLGIRVANYSGKTITFTPCTVTLNFPDTSFNVYLPEFTFDSMYNIYFWVADNGGTYYANTAKSAGHSIDCGPDMSAAETIAAGDEYLAAVPEPATVALLGLGGMLLCRKRPA
ncbi:MAG TPA: PEP-CTERM sorting domain-containing protein [Sedimentisphaerales bacterium]|nr:PEP-CTERM sorting domain-containing protein [Sedimentisphaerales bacterium]